MTKSPSLVFLVAASFFGCVGPPAADGIPSFDEFRDSLPLDVEEGSYIVEGDIALTTDELRDYYDHYVYGPASGDDNDLVAFSIVRATDRDVVWDVHRKLRLTYCVSNDFGQGKAKVRDALVTAANDWERATHVNFIYRSQFDSTCARGQVDTEKVLFTVEPVSASFNAKAFFPDYGEEKWQVLISGNGMAKTGGDFVGMLRHELGHVLGLRHEHILNPVSCTEEKFKDARSLTPFDNGSVMHYDWCDGAAGPNETLTRYDILGVKQLYSLPPHQWAAKLSGTAFPMRTDYNGDGKTDILFYTTEAGAAAELSLGTSDFDFPTAPKVVSGLPGARPLAGHFTGTSAFSQDLLVYRPGPGGDHFASSHVLPNGETIFKIEQTNAGGVFQPLVGEFNGQFGTDVFWYGPGPAADAFWMSSPAGHQTEWSFINGYYIPLVGDFNGDGLSDFVWYDPASSSSPVWRMLPQGGVDIGAVAHGAVGLEAGAPYVAIQGDFNGDEKSDVFWYRPGSASDRLWLGGTSGPAHQSLARTVSGTYKPFTGDFNGDGRTDIFWYRPGSGKDYVWYFDAAGGHTSKTLSVFGDYAPFAGDFDGDFDDDILWLNMASGTSAVWRADGNWFTSLGDVAVPTNRFPVGYGGTY